MVRRSSLSIPPETQQRLLSGLTLASLGLGLSGACLIFFALETASLLFLLVGLGLLAPLPLLSVAKQALRTDEPISEETVLKTPVVKAHVPAPSVSMPDVGRESAPPQLRHKAVAPAPSEPSWSEKIDWEEWVGQKLLQKLGIAIVLIGVLVFLKYSFDNRWIDELGRILMGVVFAGLLLAVGEWNQRRYPQWAQGFTGGGLVALYFCVWIAHVFYHNQLLNTYGLEVGPTFAIFLYSLITAGGVLAAVRYRSPIISWFAMVGGYLTPLLISTMSPSPVGLALYLAVLAVGLLTLWWWTSWKHLPTVSFLATQFYLWAMIYNSPDADINALTQTVIAVGFFTIFNALPLVAQFRRREKTDGNDLLLIVLNGLAVFGAIVDALGGRFDAPLVLLLCLALAAVYALFSAAALRLRHEDSALVNTYLTGTFVMIALALLHQLTWQWVILGWAPLSVALLFLSVQLRRSAPLYSAIALICACLGLLILHLPLTPDLEQLWLPFRSHWAIESYMVGAAVIAWLLLLERLPEQLLSKEERRLAWSMLHGVLAATLFLAVTFETTQAHIMANLPLTLGYLGFGAIALGMFAFSGCLAWFLAALIAQMLTIGFIFLTGDGSGMISPSLGSSLGSVTPLWHPWALASLLSVALSYGAYRLTVRHEQTREPNVRSLLFGVGLAQLWVHVSVELQHAGLAYAWSDLVTQRALAVFWIVFALGLLAWSQRKRSDRMRLAALLLLLPPFLQGCSHLQSLQFAWFELVIWTIVPLGLATVGVLRKQPLIKQWGIALLCITGTVDLLAHAGFAADFVRTLWWAAVAVVALGLGFWLPERDLRRTGIIFFGVVAAKLLLLDFATFSPLPRTVGSIVTGLLMIAGSYLYQRYADRISTSK